MVRTGRPHGCISLLVVSLLLAIAASAGGFLASTSREHDRAQDGFLAYGEVSIAIVGDEVNTLRTTRCMASSFQAGTDVRQGTAVVVSLDGRAVGGGNLSSGTLKRRTTLRGNTEWHWAYCKYTFSAPVSRPGDGQYTLDIGDAKVAFTMDDLQDGVNLELR